MSIDEEHHCPAACNDMQLIPITGSPVAFELVRIIKCGKHSGTLSCSKRRTYDLAAKGPIRPRRHSAPWSGATFDQRSCIAVLVIDIGLVPARLPFRHSVTGNFAEQRC